MPQSTERTLIGTPSWQRDVSDFAMCLAWVIDAKRRWAELTAGGAAFEV